MASPLQRLTDRKALTVNRSGIELNADGWWYPISGGSYASDKETLPDSFESMVSEVYKRNGIVAACIAARAMPLSQGRFQFRDYTGGRPGKWADDPSLRRLDTPWPNGTSGDLIWRMEQNGSLAGNAYIASVAGGTRLRNLRPDWVTIISGVNGDDAASPFDLEAEVLAYIYEPPGYKATLLSPDRVAHWSPEPDPVAQWRGMSWVTSVLSEIDADLQATTHKRKFFQQGATLGTVIRYDKMLAPEVVQRHAAIFAEQHAGSRNAYRALHIGGGADVSVVGTNLKDLDFSATQGAGETRIAARAGVGAIIARLSEGLAGSSLNQGNYDAAKRQFADMTLRPLWSGISAALQKFTSPPTSHRLDIDPRDVEFLKDDRKAATEIQQMQAATITSLVQAGYTPDSVVVAIETNDFTRLVHGGLYSVQLQKPGGGDEPLSLDRQVESAGALVRAGYDPGEALRVVGLDPIRHLGLLPVTLQSTRQLELTPGEADAVTT